MDQSSLLGQRRVRLRPRGVAALAAALARALSQI